MTSKACGPLSQDLDRLSRWLSIRGRYKRHRARKRGPAAQASQKSKPPVRLPYSSPASAPKRTKKSVLAREIVPQESTFLSRLPLELREQIYDLVISPTQFCANSWNEPSVYNKCLIEWESPDDSNHCVFAKRRNGVVRGHYLEFHRGTRFLDLLLVSRQVYAEFSAWLYSITTFVFTARDTRDSKQDTAHGFDAFAQTIPVDRLPLISSFRITYTPLPYTMRDSQVWGGPQKLAAWETMWSILERQSRIKVIEVVVSYLKGGPQILEPLVRMKSNHLERFDIFFNDKSDYETYLTHIDKHPQGKSAPRPFRRRPSNNTRLQTRHASNNIQFQSRDASSTVELKDLERRVGIMGFSKVFPHNGIYVATSRKDLEKGPVAKEWRGPPRWGMSEFLKDVHRFKNGNIPAHVCCDRQHTFEIFRRRSLPRGRVFEVDERSLVETEPHYADE